MDLTRLLERLRGHPDACVFSMEIGDPVKRTHAELASAVRAAADRLRAWGVWPGTRVGLRAPNSYEWIVYDLALISVRAVSVAFTDDFAGARVDDLVRKYDLSLMLVPKPARGADRAHPSYVAYIDAEADNDGVHVVGRSGPDDGDDPDCLWRIFSSGSSGGLKGITVNRKGVEDWVESFSERVQPRADDRIVLFLPFSNFQQRPMYYAALWHGLDAIVTTPARLFAAFTRLRPTILIAPPTLYEMFATRVANMPAGKRRLALTLGSLAAMLPTTALRRRAGAAIFRPVHDALGGRMRFMVTGMAPIKRSTLELFALMQLPLFETYGLVECGSVALNVPGAARIGSVGRPLSLLDVTLAADGEIIVRRDHPTAVGYFECAPGEHERTFLGNNRVATGDHGRFDRDGYLYLVGRKKELIITAGGMKIHPEAVEREIDACPEVAKSVVFGADGASSLAAVIVLKRPDEAAAREHVERFVQRLNEHARPIEVGELVFTDVQFSPENGFLRPNLKLDRARIRDHFLARPAADSPAPDVASARHV